MRIDAHSMRISKNRRLANPNEDTYSMDQSLREEAVLALEAETRTNPLRRRMGPSLERAEKIETFS